MTTPFRIIALGDVVGRPGRTALKQKLPGLRQELHADMVIVNGENAAGGAGIDISCAEEIFGSGADVITLGDHTFQKREIKEYLKDNAHRIIRPANYSPGAPGEGYTIRNIGDVKVGVMNLMGRVFMNLLLDCPFQKADELLAGPLGECTIILCDMHCEATSEKIAMGRYLDTRVSGVFGTHTHVQTADEQVLPGGTGYISDLGMSGALSGVIGMDHKVALNRFLTGMPHAYEVAAGEGTLSGALFECDRSTGKALSVSRVSR